MKEDKEFLSHSACIALMNKAREADSDMRENSREAALFVTKRGGMWEEGVVNNTTDKPRYTFDITNPHVKQVCRVMTKRDYDIRILPAGGDASKENAKTYDGLVRHIEDISDARQRYNRAGKSMVVRGLDGWEVCQKYVDGDSFDQDLVIKSIPNFTDHVWFGHHTEQDASDAEIAWKLVGYTQEDYKKKYPNRSESQQIEVDRSQSSYYDKEDLVMVGACYYLKPVERTLYLMSNGKVYEDDEEFRRIRDELAADGVTVSDERKRTKKVCYIREFDLAGWISSEKETVFQEWLPLVPCYGNFDYVEDKITYSGAVEKLIDPQRVYNYSRSREIEEGALAPREKTWMTEEQAEGHEKSLQTQNTNSQPVQLYNHQDNAAPPYKTGGPQINPGLAHISDSMQGIVSMASGMFDANMGRAPDFQQSGKAIEALSDRGDDTNNEYIESREIAQRHTGRILVKAIPRVYKPGRQVRILREDNSFDIETIGESYIDNESGRLVTLNDLSTGSYDVTCTSGPSFQNRQSETVTAILEIGQVDPTIIQSSADILTKSINSPGMDQVAERIRRRLFMAGEIPPEQMTDEEKQEMQALQNQPPQEDPMMVAARAEEAKAQADLLDAQTKQMETQGNIQIKSQELQVRSFEAETKRFEAEIKKAEAIAGIKKSGADAAKSLAEAEAQDIENIAVESGITKLQDMSRAAFSG